MRSGGTTCWRCASDAEQADRSAQSIGDVRERAHCLAKGVRRVAYSSSSGVSVSLTTVSGCFLAYASLTYPPVLMLRYRTPSSSDAWLNGLAGGFRLLSGMASFPSAS